MAGMEYVLLNKNILLPNRANHHAYLANWYRHLLGFAVYILGGSYFVRQLKTNQASSTGLSVSYYGYRADSTYKMTLLPSKRSTSRCKRVDGSATAS